ncbi:uncharacterized protein LOC105421442 [Amborella trichopoda]|uniref:uncharacterized protein LOC105421442 n=1 Tax=Amborella trichopoda TaxID=13333 RepID=UPI0005D2D7AA|nr:uncharacterized protein LOC105421442 [Amborella trichopoda]|eukprot:XP_011627176.1 uncharacterized protein LOC105421442 [Amborella trichopoda]
MNNKQLTANKYFPIGWLAAKGVVDIIKSTLENSISFGFVDFQLPKKLLRVEHKLIVWWSDKRYHVKHKIDHAVKCLADLDACVQISRVLFEEQMVERCSKSIELQELRRIERRQNDISKLLINGTDPKDDNEMADAVVNHFKKAFTTEVEVTPRLARVGFKRMSACMVALLEKEVSMEEVKKAVFALPDDKAPGPDGGVNSSYIALIRKKSVIASLGDIRPISLLSIIYKIIAKVLEKRLKIVLPDTITGPQSVFINDRLIIDNVLVAQECIHSKILSGEAGVVIKLDIEKAYDMVRPDQLANIATFLSFCEVALGLKVNFDKSIVVGINCGETLLSEIAAKMGCKVESFPIMYLGPISGGRLPLVVWDKIPTRVAKKFLWDSFENSKKLYLLHWDRVYTPRKEGGLGIRRIKLVTRLYFVNGGGEA